MKKTFLLTLSLFGALSAYESQVLKYEYNSKEFQKLALKLKKDSLSKKKEEPLEDIYDEEIEPQIVKKIKEMNRQDSRRIGPPQTSQYLDIHLKPASSLK